MEKQICICRFTAPRNYKTIKASLGTFQNGWEELAVSQNLLHDMSFQKSQKSAIVLNE